MIGFVQGKTGTSATERKKPRNRPFSLDQQGFDVVARESMQWLRELGSSAEKK
nr:hypothetical protein [uncultured Pseudomonas sp.]